MRALVLAAGYGDRLRPLTDRIPKPMIEIGGKPILQHNLELLVRAGVREIAVNVHYRPDSIRTYFGDGFALGAALTFLYEPELLGTAGAVRNAAEFLRGDDFLVVYGDNLSTIDLRALIARHRESGAELTMGLYHRDDPGQSGVVSLDQSDRITRFVEKPNPKEIFSHWVNAGYLVAKPSLLDAIPDRTPCDLGRDVFPPLLERGAKLAGYRMTEELWWIDTLEDYRRTAASHPDLRGRSVIVTGASMGIGNAAARICLESGARVTMCARGAEALEESSSRFAALYPNAVASVVADVAQHEDVVRLFDAATERFGRIDGVIHAAGILGDVTPVENSEPQRWLHTIEVDLFGSYLMTRESCRRLERGGRIVLFSGGGASYPWPDHAAYACSKIAVVRLAETVAEEMRPRGVEINAVAPGLVATRMTAQMDTSRAVPPERGARAAAFLISSAARGITGKLVSAVYDRYWNWPEHLQELNESDAFTLRRILPKERGMDWQ